MWRSYSYCERNNLLIIRKIFWIITLAENVVNQYFGSLGQHCAKHRTCNGNHCMQSQSLFKTCEDRLSWHPQIQVQTCILRTEEGIWLQKSESVMVMGFICVDGTANLNICEGTINPHPSNWVPFIPQRHILCHLTYGPNFFYYFVNLFVMPPHHGFPFVLSLVFLKNTNVLGPRRLHPIPPMQFK